MKISCTIWIFIVLSLEKTTDKKKKRRIQILSTCTYWLTILYDIVENYDIVESRIFL